MISTLAKRIIPCLDIKNGRTVKGVHFEDLKDAGDPVELAEMYSLTGADELVFLDITATNEKRRTLVGLVRAVARRINIPFTVGGGISSLDDAARLLDAGADKISVNSAAIHNPSLISEIAGKYGSQFLVVAVDTRHVGDHDIVHVRGGLDATPWKTYDWIHHAVALGAGEILLTSMDHDGTKNGFNLTLLQSISEKCIVPVIASGGAGTGDHFLELFTKTNVDAALAASVFHFGQIRIPDLKRDLAKAGIPMRL